MQFSNLPEGITAKWLSQNNQSQFFQGDSLQLMKAMPDASVDCIWTDPPYFLSNDGVTCIAGRMVKVNKGEWDRSNGILADHEFNKMWLKECFRILKPTGTIWVSGTLHVYLSVGMAMMEVGFRILNDIIWEKPAPPPNLGCRCFTHSTEVILWATKGKKGKDRYIFNYEEMKDENGGKQMKNVWRIMTPSKDEKEFGKHPTQKPIALIERCLRASTKPDDIVFDPFSGSATTGVAALNLGRNFIGIERENSFVQLAVQRLWAADNTLHLGQSNQSRVDATKERPIISPPLAKKVRKKVANKTPGVVYSATLFDE
jgi:site-specific DNA-methyltransferase (adenine-specific)